VPNLDLEKVRMLVRMSRQTDEPGTPTGGAGDAVTVEGAGGLDIPDNDASGVTQTVNVDADFAAGNVTVDLDIAHTYVGDLTIELSHNGVTRAFYNRVGGSSDDVRDSFVVPGFAGESARGEWKLHIVDNARLDEGRLNAWRLTVSPAGDDTPTVDPGERGESMTFNGEGGLAIPDNDATGISSRVSVPNGTEGRVQVSVDITHTYRGDLRVTLSNGSQSFTLSDREGGAADNLVDTFPVDVSGDLGGSWTLSVSDNAGVDTGTLNGWALIVDSGR
jgi:subtilisin-like proprotein convertase family protein